MTAPSNSLHDAEPLLDFDSTQCNIHVMVLPQFQISRAFKTAWFSRAARKARIPDQELWEAAQEAMAGQANDLGGGVFKKRLNKNLHRSIILAKGGSCWVFVFLYAKKDRANIDREELAAFRAAADAFVRKPDSDLVRDIKANILMEINNDSEAEIQK